MKVKTMAEAQKYILRRSSFKWGSFRGHNSRVHKGMYVVSYRLMSGHILLNIAIYEPRLGVWAIYDYGVPISDGYRDIMRLDLPVTGYKFSSPDTMEAIRQGGMAALVRARLQGET